MTRRGREAVLAGPAPPCDDAAVAAATAAA
eukprot:COSAG01_NODE_13861_length_1526_cov_15.158485_1_plen_29_part_10